MKLELKELHLKLLILSGRYLMAFVQVMDSARPVDVPQHKRVLSVFSTKCTSDIGFGETNTRSSSHVVNFGSRNQCIAAFIPGPAFRKLSTVAYRKRVLSTAYPAWCRLMQAYGIHRKYCAMTDESMATDWAPNSAAATTAQALT